PVSPDRGYYWARDSRHSPFPSQLFALGNTKNCCSGLNCADNCTRSGRGLCPPDSMGGPENEKHSLSVMERTERTRHCEIGCQDSILAGTSGPHDFEALRSTHEPHPSADDRICCSGTSRLCQLYRLSPAECSRRSQCSPRRQYYYRSH